MKDHYSKLFDIVVREGEERLRRKKIIMQRCTRAAFSVAGSCAVIFVGFCIWHNNDIKDIVNRKTDNSMIIKESSTTDITSAEPETSKPVVTSASAAVVTQTTRADDISQQPQTTNIQQTGHTEQPTDSSATVKIRDIKLDAPDTKTISSKFSEIRLDDNILYRLKYTDINASTIGTKKKTIEITNTDTAANKRYIVSADIYSVSLESSENMIAVKYSGSDELYLYYALSDDKFSLDWVKFNMPFDKYEFGYISCGLQRVGKEKVGKLLGDAALNGRNDFTGEDISLAGKVYKIDGISSDCGLAVMYDNDDEYHLFRNIAYKPETLGHLIVDMDLENTMTINGVYVNGSFYEIAPEMVWRLLLSERNAENYGHGIAPCDYGVSVDIPLLGRKNIAINVYSDGHISTNIAESTASFNIGKENAEAFIEYVERYGVLIGKEPSDNSGPVDE